jgi:hypothetical protein
MAVVGKSLSAAPVDVDIDVVAMYCLFNDSLLESNI